MNTQFATHTYRKQRTEQGQALVLIVLAIVGLMGFAALAVDLGRVYAERRRAQSAVDASSLAWAYAASQVESGGIYNLDDITNKVPAYTSLLQNGYSDIPDRVSIELFWPPQSGPYGPDSALTEEERAQYFQVVLHTRVDQIFSQFVFSGSQNLTVEAVAHAVPTRSISPGNALMASKKDACPGIIFNGNVETYIDGGNIFSNSDKSGPGSCYSGITTGSSGKIEVTDGDINVAGGWSDGGGIVDPEPNKGVDQEDLPDVPKPNCDGFETRSKSNPLLPGKYSGLSIKNTDDITMEPGMYCFTSDFSISGSLRGEGVMIVMNQGDFSITGNGDIFLKRANDIVDSAGQHYGGMLLFMPFGNKGGIDIGGNSNMQFSGTIFAPDERIPNTKEKCQVGGNGGSSTIITLTSSIICSSVKIHGTSSVNIVYMEEANYRMPPTVELAQ